VSVFICELVTGNVDITQHLLFRYTYNYCTSLVLVQNNFYVKIYKEIHTVATVVV